MANRNWSRDELIIAFNLYCKTPFSKIGKRDKGIIDTAEYLGRSVSAVALKLANFARLDPALQSRNVSGMKNGSKGEVEIWNEFHQDWEKLAYESEKILAKAKGAEIETLIELELESEFVSKQGKEKEVTIRQRVNQSFFRKIILTSYNNRCCITEIDVPELLIASHIIPWSKDKKNRVNPTNGLCLNSLHDKAFDRGLLTITTDFKVLFSRKLLEKEGTSFYSQYIAPYHQKKVLLPQRFIPERRFLEYHNKNIFQSE